jgi:hypothetical protein
MRDAGGQSSPMAVVCIGVGERKKTPCWYLVEQSRADHWSKQEERNGTMNYRSFVRDYLTLLGSRAAVDDKMKNKATSAETIESVIIASMLYCS